MKERNRSIDRSSRESGGSSGPNTGSRTNRRGASKNKSSVSHMKYENRVLRESRTDIYLGHASRGLPSLEDAAKLTLMAMEGFEYQPLRSTGSAEKGISFQKENAQMTVDADIAKILAGGDRNSDNIIATSDPTMFQLDLGDGRRRSGPEYAYDEWIVRSIGVRKRWVIPYDKIDAAKRAGFLVQRMGPECQPERVTKVCLENLARNTHENGGRVIRMLNYSERKDGVI